MMSKVCREHFQLVVAQPAQEWAWALSLCIQHASILSIIIIWLLVYALGSPGGSVIKNLSANAGDAGSIPELGRSPGEGKWQSTPVFLPGKFHGQRSLAGYSPWGTIFIFIYEFAFLQIWNYLIVPNTRRNQKITEWWWLPIKGKMLICVSMLFFQFS